MVRIVERLILEVARRVPYAHGIVAVSGGPDSVALLRILRQVGNPVIVAHVNHQQRGAESDADEAFVAELAKRLKSPFRSTRITIPADENFEAAARQERYEWFQSLEGQWIATGHTADDQAETVLHRLIRGTGLQGLRGIHHSVAAPPGGKAILRPMLNVTRAELISYLDSLQQSYRVDSSNEDRRFTRNRIRHELLPLLKEFNPEIVDLLGRLSQQSAEAFDIIQMKARERLEEVERPRAGSLLIFDGLQLSERTRLHLRREVLRCAWQREGWPLGDMTFDHWQRLGHLQEGDYPGGIRLTHAERVVQLGPRS